MIFVSERYEHYGDECNYFSLQVRMADLTSSFILPIACSHLPFLISIKILIESSTYMKEGCKFG